MTNTDYEKNIESLVKTLNDIRHVLLPFQYKRDVDIINAKKQMLEHISNAKHILDDVEATLRVFPITQEEALWKQYEITYNECYSKTFNVLASNEEEAKQKVLDGIAKGDFDLFTADNCYESGITHCKEG